MSNITQLLKRLNSVKQTGPNRWMACCPAHDDHTPSLSIREVGDGLILLKDFGGCETHDVLNSLGMKMADLFPERVRGSHEFMPHHLPARSARRRSRIPLADLISVLSHDVTIVAIVATHLLEEKEISSADWNELRAAASRIQRARDHLHD